MFNFFNFFKKKRVTDKKAIQVINYIKKTIKENEKKIGNSKSYEEIVQLTKKCNLLDNITTVRRTISEKKIIELDLYNKVYCL